MHVHVHVQRAVRPLVLRTERQKYTHVQYVVRLQPQSASRPTDPAPSLMSSAPGRAAVALRPSHLYMADHSGPQAGGVPVRASMRASRRSSSPYASRPSAAAATVASRSTRPDVCRTCRYSQTHVDTVRHMSIQSDARPKSCLSDTGSPDSIGADGIRSPEMQPSKLRHTRSDRNSRRTERLCAAGLVGWRNSSALHIHQRACLCGAAFRRTSMNCLSRVSS